MHARVCVLCTNLYECLWVGVGVCTRIKVRNGCQVPRLISLPYILRWGLFLFPEFTISGSLPSQSALGIPAQGSPFSAF